MLDAAFQLELPVLVRRNTQINVNKFADMLKERLKHCRFSGLTDVRTVSDELTDSSSYITIASDQTLRSLGNVFGKNEI